MAKQNLVDLLLINEELFRGFEVCEFNRLVVGRTLKSFGNIPVLNVKFSKIVILSVSSVSLSVSIFWRHQMTLYNIARLDLIAPSDYIEM